MVILDIDQDFFFSPGFFGTILEAKETNHTNMIQMASPSDIINRFNIKGMKYKIFTDHDEVLYDILRNDYKEIKLLHLDAHSDVVKIKENNTSEEYCLLREFPYEKVTLANWLNYLIASGRVFSIDFVHNNPEEYYLGRELICGSYKSNAHYFKYDKHPWKGDIDVVYYTQSPEWCPPNNLVEEFKRDMNA